MRFLAIIIVSAVVSVVAGAVSCAQSLPYPTLGVGNETCDIWTTDRRRGIANFEEQWALGSVSAQAMMLGYIKSQGTGFAIQNVDQVLDWIDGECLRAPSETLGQASINYVTDAGTFKFLSNGN